MSGWKWQRTHAWRDSRGRVAFFHARYLKPDGTMVFPFYTPCVDGEETVTLGRGKVAVVRSGFPAGHKALVYRLPELLKALKSAVPEVWCCEGEKDADSLVEVGLVATTGWGGAGKWKPEQADWFKGYQGTVNVLVDNDPPGAAEGVLKYESLKALGVRVELLRPLGHKDVSDLLAAGGSVGDLEEIEASDLRPLAKVAPTR